MIEPGVEAAVLTLLLDEEEKKKMQRDYTPPMSCSWILKPSETVSLWFGRL